MKKVVCNKSKTCKMRKECGGAIPHELCSECGKCPFAKRIDAKCEELKTTKMEFITGG
jgi:hypothetical protein